tara:strand:+ start:430 stop:747 length:318 start_codon:yes stop_codon:yes gene_type:complete
MKNIFSLIAVLLISSISFSQTYIPNNNAVLASSKSCFNKMMAAVNGGDMAGFEVLQRNNCVLVYNSSTHRLELVMLEVGGIAKPSVYYITLRVIPMQKFGLCLNN